MTPEEFFLVRSVKLARSMPPSDGVIYLRGLLRICGEQPILDGVRRAYADLHSADAQLELIAGGQPLLPLSDINREDGSQ